MKRKSLTIGACVASLALAVLMPRLLPVSHRQKELPANGRQNVSGPPLGLMKRKPGSPTAWPMPRPGLHRRRIAITKIAPSREAAHHFAAILCVTRWSGQVLKRSPNRWVHFGC